MIDISAHVTQLLQPLKIPTYFNTVPTGSTIPSQYITFLEINANAELEAGDTELNTERLIQINVWSKGNYFKLVEDIRKTMELAGFERTFESDIPKQEGDSRFNKVMRFVFFDEY